MKGGRRRRQSSTGVAPGPAAPFLRAAIWAIAVLAVGLGVSDHVLAVVHSTALLVLAVLLSAAVAAFLLWNAAAAASGARYTGSWTGSRPPASASRPMDSSSRSPVLFHVVIFHEG
ncbi:hypothetical protein BS78_07G066500 [Paspalum vaginatum]|nr:hypothetical protein BS78_07G066500 [Paspalum vaginatum]